MMLKLGAITTASTIFAVNANIMSEAMY